MQKTIQVFSRFEKQLILLTVVDKINHKYKDSQRQYSLFANLNPNT